MLKAKIAACAAIAMLATGCATHKQTGQLAGAVIGAAVLGPVGSGAAAHAAGALVGGAVGAGIGGKMAERSDARNVKASTTVVTESRTSYSTPAPVAQETTVQRDTSETTVVTKKKVRE